MPKQMVEQYFCDYPRCEGQAPYRCLKCEQWFCLSHVANIIIGSLYGRARCFACVKELYPCLSSKIDEQIYNLSVLKEGGKGVFVEPA